MRSLIISAALLAATPALAADVDIVPNGYIAQVMREAAAARAQGSRAPAVEAPPAAATRAAPRQPAAARSRVQVIAETTEAARLGLLGAGEGEPPAASAEELEQIRQAGLRAAAVSTTARR